MSELNSKQLTDVLNHFKIKGAVENCTRYGNGHINDTYLVICTQENVEYKYILQALNNNVFKESEKVMQNIEKVIKYLKPMVKDKREILNHILTFDNSTFTTSSSFIMNLFGFLKILSMYGTICSIKSNHS